jgi:hypothetical protein
VLVTDDRTTGCLLHIGAVQRGGSGPPMSGPPTDLPARLHDLSRTRQAWQCFLSEARVDGERSESELEVPDER